MRSAPLCSHRVKGEGPVGLANQTREVVERRVVGERLAVDAHDAVAGPDAPASLGGTRAPAAVARRKAGDDDEVARVKPSSAAALGLVRHAGLVHDRGACEPFTHRHEEASLA